MLRVLPEPKEPAMSLTTATKLLALLSLVLVATACAEIRANERPQNTNPMWTPQNQGGNRP